MTVAPVAALLCWVHGGVSPADLPRRGVLVRATSAVAAAGLSAPRSQRAAAAEARTARVTQRAFIDLRIIESYTMSEVLENAALRGRMTIGLYGEDAPKQTRRFIEELTGRKDGGEGPAESFPPLSSALFERIQPGKLLLSGNIVGLKEVRLPDSLGGGVQYEYAGAIVPMRTVLESNSLSHDRRGLLTKRVFAGGSEFGITLAPAPELDREWEVFGEVLDGAGPTGLLAEIEALPYLSGAAAPQSKTGAVGAAVYRVQRDVFASIGRSLGDKRADDNVGKLLRRVEIVRTGLL